MVERVELPAPEHPLVSVLIPAARNPGLLERCLRSLAAAALPDAPGFETVVVLNGATPEVRELTLERAAGVRVVELAVNAGVAGALNRARAVARGELLALLHDDAEVASGWLEPLVRCVRERPEVGVAGSRLLDPDGKLQAAGAVVWRDGRTTPVGAGAPPDAFAEGAPVDSCPTASSLIPATVWDSIGGADEAMFPAYYVDVELSARVREAGHVAWYEPASCVRHRRGSSNPSGFRHFLMEQNRRRFVAKRQAELRGHEPLGEDLSSSVERALGRARAEAARARPRPRATPASPQPPPLDERALLQRELELKDGYLRQQAAELERAQRELVRVDGLAGRQHAELGRLSAELDAVYNGGWWRLRERLLPLLRLARRRGRA
jgi:GT2 family glycosyltransferase